MRIRLSHKQAEIVLSALQELERGQPLTDDEKHVFKKLNNQVTPEYKLKNQ